MTKKGISPLIAVVLIVGFTIILAVIIVNFILNVAEEQTESTECEADATKECMDFVSEGSFEASFSEVNLGDPDPDTITIFNFAGATADFIISYLDEDGNTMHTATISGIGTGQSGYDTCDAGDCDHANGISAANILPSISWDQDGDQTTDCTVTCTDSLKKITVA